MSNSISGPVKCSGSGTPTVVRRTYQLISGEIRTHLQTPGIGTYALTSGSDNGGNLAWVR
jgi:hypothetical protein